MKSTHHIDHCIDFIVAFSKTQLCRLLCVFPAKRAQIQQKIVGKWLMLVMPWIITGFHVFKTVEANCHDVESRFWTFGNGVYLHIINKCNPCKIVLKLHKLKTILLPTSIHGAVIQTCYWPRTKFYQIFDWPTTSFCWPTTSFCFPSKISLLAHDKVF